jgi:hypothetical protein
MSTRTIQAAAGTAYEETPNRDSGTHLGSATAGIQRDESRSWRELDSGQNSRRNERLTETPSMYALNADAC